MRVQHNNPDSIDIRRDFQQWLCGSYSAIKQKSSLSQIYALLVFVQFIVISIASTSSALAPILASFFTDFSVFISVLFVLAMHKLMFVAASFYRQCTSEVYKFVSLLVVMITLVFSSFFGAAAIIKVFNVEQQLLATEQQKSMLQLQQQAYDLQNALQVASASFYNLERYSAEQAQIEERDGGTCQVGVAGGEGPRTWFRKRFASDASVHATNLADLNEQVDIIIQDLSQASDRNHLFQLTSRLNSLMSSSAIQSVNTYARTELEANRGGVYASPARFRERFFECPDHILQTHLQNVQQAFGSLSMIEQPEFQAINATSGLELSFSVYRNLAKGDFEQVPTLAYIAIVVQLFIDGMLMYLHKILSYNHAKITSKVDLLNTRAIRNTTLAALNDFQDFLLMRRNFFGGYQLSNNNSFGQKIFLQMKHLGLAKQFGNYFIISNPNLALLIDVLERHAQHKAHHSHSQG